MFALDCRFPMDSQKVVSLPSDLMCVPIQGKDETSICHSDTVGKWYVLRNLDNMTIVDGEEIFTQLIDLGSWVDIARYYFDPCFDNAPFYWGKTYKNNRYPDRLQYIPIWQSVPTGAYNDEGLPNMKEVYQLVTIMPYYSPFKADNPIQYNFDTRFQVKDYGENLIELAEDLELFTGLKF